MYSKLFVWVGAVYANFTINCDKFTTSFGGKKKLRPAKPVVSANVSDVDASVARVLP
jgi:hypothetical protein